MTSPSRAVLVVEDDEHIRELVCLHLELEGMQCVRVGDGEDALQRAAAQDFDLIVLDLMIPGLDGITVCRAIRRSSRNTDVPILMLTARREESDKVVGLESGADDYLTKPFGVRELVARVHALLRRRPPLSPGEDQRAPRGAAVPREPERQAAADDRLFALAVHGVEIDPPRRRVRVRGQEVALTNQEFNLLHLLASSPGIVFSREALLARVWTTETFVTVRSVDTLVKRVRRKIEQNAANPELILTVWGVGYKMADV
jgi:DNA-binding response OmpR family regulator